ncbi:hypothetical protein JSQ81_16365 [Sporosarcina sp. Marseille-Q4063]|uniref:hypothetical protein n=1 Tax=Sporosarcina sp. Marseille-Q4063 TaxID=2810514 RepID=UPI001BB00B7B|nr:hypothetical protein [Sporosarcina sp. Marseille-Q4063]QUW21362.1 hypothetical protein JSQ81_16365 [Sporosarcina sp. Marseille-Q4063]
MLVRGNQSKANQIITDKINMIRKSDSEDKIRVELYSIITFMILSTEIFPKNIDIKRFLIDKDDIFKEFRPYLYASRTILLARILRVISSKEKRFLYNFSLDLKSKLDEFSESENSGKLIVGKSSERSRKSKNYTDSLFERFKREE